MLLSPINLFIREFHFTVMQWQQIDVQESVHIYRLLMFFCSLQPTGIIFLTSLLLSPSSLLKFPMGLLVKVVNFCFK